MKNTIYHLYVERLTGLSWKPERPLKLYWQHLPETARTPQMKRFLLALGLTSITEEELSQLWQQVKNSTVIFMSLED
jgi:NAD-dependent DNA ligase